MMLWSWVRVLAGQLRHADWRKRGVLCAFSSAEARPDVLLMQETKVQDGSVPREVFRDAG